MADARATIDFRSTCPPPTRYDVVCGEHGLIGSDLRRHDAPDTALVHDMRQHGGEADWLYDGVSILDSFGESSANDSPAAIAVGKSVGPREVAQANRL